ncbi:hypothetical protein AMECASPLE_038425 [Ameca splendens]|uniref:BED-type domain-containing protein n=1 Tax=Ameca splendens TaxID=208324 RepID=A0ABV0ZIZ5_9TELE
MWTKIYPKIKFKQTYENPHKRGKWLRFKCSHYGRCKICVVKFKASGGNTSNLRKHLVKHHIFIKAEEFTVFVSLRYMPTTPAFSTVNPPANGCNLCIKFVPY